MKKFKITFKTNVPKSTTTKEAYIIAKNKAEIKRTVAPDFYYGYHMATITEVEYIPANGIVLEFKS